jgi:hypothetical protein
MNDPPVDVRLRSLSIHPYYIFFNPPTCMRYCYYYSAIEITETIHLFFCICLAAKLLFYVELSVVFNIYFLSQTCCKHLKKTL